MQADKQPQIHSQEELQHTAKEQEFEKKGDIKLDSDRVYAEGSIVDSDKVVKQGQTTAAGGAVGITTTGAAKSPLRNNDRPDGDHVSAGNSSDDGDGVVYPETGSRPPSQPSYQAAHNDESVPNYRDEIYRDPGENLIEGQNAAKYDEQKRAVDDGRNYIPGDPNFVNRHADADHDHNFQGDHKGGTNQTDTYSKETHKE